MADGLPREIERPVQLFERREDVVPIWTVETAEGLFDLGQSLLCLSQHMAHGRNDVLWLDSIKSWQPFGDEQWVVFQFVR